MESSPSFGIVPILPTSSCSLFWHPQEPMCSKHLLHLFARIFTQCGKIYLPYYTLALAWRRLKSKPEASEKAKLSSNELIEFAIEVLKDTGRTALWLSASYVAAGSGMCLSRYLMGYHSRFSSDRHNSSLRWAHMVWTMVTTAALSSIEDPERRRAWTVSWFAIAVETVARLAMSRELVHPRRGAMVDVFAVLVFVTLSARRINATLSELLRVPMDVLLPDETKQPLSARIIAALSFLASFAYAKLISRQPASTAVLSSSKHALFVWLLATFGRNAASSLGTIPVLNKYPVMIDALIAIGAGQIFKLENSSLTTPIIVYFLVKAVESHLRKACPSIMKSEWPYLVMMSLSAPLTQMAMFWENHHVPRPFASFVYRTTGEPPFPEGPGYNALRAAIEVPLTKPTSWWF